MASDCNGWLITRPAFVWSSMEILNKVYIAVDLETATDFAHDANTISEPPIAWPQPFVFEHYTEWEREILTHLRGALTISHPNSGQKKR
jgi:hypothetical protein